jgi:hypothetical protein
MIFAGLILTLAFAAVAFTAMSAAEAKPPHLCVASTICAE